MTDYKAAYDNAMRGAVLNYRAVQPIGKRKAFGHVHYADKPHEWGEIEIDDYPPSPEGEKLRGLRLRLGMGLREAAHALGLTAVQLSNVERGGAVVDWAEAANALRNSRAPSRYRVCPDCHGNLRFPCSVCTGGHPDCDRCEGQDQEDCARCGGDGVVREP